MANRSDRPQRKRPRRANATGIWRFGTSTPAPVLLVDDDPDVREAMAVALRALRRPVLTAANGEEALEATRLLQLAAPAEFFHSPGQEAFATIVVNGHAETWPLKSRTFRIWLQRLFHRETGTIPGGPATQDALKVLTGQALFEGRAHPVFTRLAEQDGAIYLNRGDPEWASASNGRPESKTSSPAWRSGEPDRGARCNRLATTTRKALWPGVFYRGR